jgi:hypothetical protein
MSMASWHRGAVALADATGAAAPGPPPPPVPAGEPGAVTAIGSSESARERGGGDRRQAAVMTPLPLAVIRAGGAWRDRFASIVFFFFLSREFLERVSGEPGLTLLSASVR